MITGNRKIPKPVPEFLPCGKVVAMSVSRTTGAKRGRRRRESKEGEREVSESRRRNLPRFGQGAAGAATEAAADIKSKIRTLPWAATPKPL